MNKAKGSGWGMSPALFKTLLLIQLLYEVRFLARYLLGKARGIRLPGLLVCALSSHNEVLFILFLFFWLQPSRSLLDLFLKKQNKQTLWALLNNGTRAKRKQSGALR